jgi:phosphatidylinositol kinase/protein kinase (PI-3  family)
MLDRYSGKLVHIDFGDCFEASMTREKYPEKVPFRLTRMMVKAMEVSGTEGNFNKTCLLTMSVLRDEKVSVMAMLEAFVFDPLINWRLLHNRPGQVRSFVTARCHTRRLLRVTDHEGKHVAANCLDRCSGAVQGVNTSQLQSSPGVTADESEEHAERTTADHLNQVRFSNCSVAIDAPETKFPVFSSYNV